MSPCLKLSLSKPRNGFVTMDVSASNGRYSGAASLIATMNELSRFRDEVSGFPRSIDQEVRLVMGSRREHEDDLASGFFSLRLYCADGTGTVGIDVEMEDDDYGFLSGCAAFSMRTFATEIDRFVVRFERALRDGEGHAELSGPGDEAGSSNGG